MFNWRKPIIFSLLYLSGSKIPQNLNLIKKLDKLSLEEKKKYQDEKLKKILLHAYNNVPYYSRILSQAGVIKDNQVFLENFKNIPLLTKEIIRKEGENLYSKDYKSRKFYENTSGGSTGEPARFLQDKNYYDWNVANKMFIKYKAGQESGQKELRFWGSERDLLDGKEKLSIRLRNWLYNRKEFNTFKMSEKQMRGYINQWNDYKPCWVESYVQSIYEFAKFIEKNNLEIYSPKNGILTSAGTLYPEMRETIERVFKCQVYNRYGSREVGDMACGRDSLALSFWNHWLDVTGEDMGEGSNIVVTGLNNFSMPIIRYEIGDVGALGNELEIKKLIGRSTDIFKTIDGKNIDGAYFRHALFYFDQIKNYQIIQKEFDFIEYRIVLRDERFLSKEDTDKIISWVKKVMGENCKIDINYFKDIPASKSGKYLYTICEIK